MAPEVIMCETLKDSPYDFKADIWSLGKSATFCFQVFSEMELQKKRLIKNLDLKFWNEIVSIFANLKNAL